VGCAGGRKASWESGKAPAASTAAADGAPASAEVQQLLETAKQGWEARGDPQKLQEAIAAWEKVAATAPTVEAQASLCRAYYFQAESSLSFDPSKSAQLLETYDRGVRAGEAAIALASPEFVSKVKSGAKWEDAVSVVGPEGVPALYWYATNLGKWASAQGFMQRLANKDRLYGTMTRILQLDPDFYYAAPHRYFGAYFAILPKAFGGDLEKSERHFREALSRAPNYLATKVLMAAELATRKQDKAMYQKLLKEVAETDTNIEPAVAPEQAVEKRKAEDLLKLTEDKF
jgi:tetratricopeptide (TPR) repeat protein